MGHDAIATLNIWATDWAGAILRAAGQGALWVVGVWLVSRVVPRPSGMIRSLLWRLTFLKLLVGLFWAAPLLLPILPPVKSSVSLPTPSQISVVSYDWTLSANVNQTSRTAAVPRMGVLKIQEAVLPVIARPSPGLSLCAVIFIVWMIAACAILGYYLYRFFVMRHMLYPLVALEDENVLDEAIQLAHRFGIKYLPRLAVSAGCGTPLVLGLLRPTIVLPADFSSRLSQEEKRLALAHELAHLRRGDLWFELLPLLLQTLFFWNPFVILAVREYAASREEACDALALRMTGEKSITLGALLLKIVSQGQREMRQSALGLSSQGCILRLRLLALRDARPEMPRSAALCLILPLSLLILPWRLTIQSHALPHVPRTIRPHYIIADLGTMESQGSFAAAINNAGQVVGGLYATRPNKVGRAFLWQEGQMHLLGALPRYRYSMANGINEQGQVIASSYNSAAYHHAFVWDGAAQTVNTLPGYRFSKALGINNAGVVVGCAQTDRRGRAGERVSRAFLWSGKQAFDLGTLGGDYSYAYGVNNHAQVVGKADIAVDAGQPVQTHAFLWQNSQMTDLGTLGGANSLAYRINDMGQAVGFAETAANARHACLWVEGQAYDLGVLGSGQRSEARSVNNLGSVVGASEFEESNGLTHAVLWTKNGMTDLNTLLPPNSPWLLEEARGINDQGWIVGEGLVQGHKHAFLLTPEIRT